MLFALDMLAHVGGRASHAQRNDFAFETHRANLQAGLAQQEHNFKLVTDGSLEDRHRNSLEAASHASSLKMDEGSHASSLKMNEGYAAHKNAMAASRLSNKHEVTMTNLNAQSNAHEINRDKLRYKDAGADRAEGARQFDMTHRLKEKAFDRASDTLGALDV